MDHATRTGRHAGTDRGAVTDAALLPAIAARWSPRAFDPSRPLTGADMAPLLEAARWAASSNNMQPWRLAWALRGEAAFDRMLACLSEGNRAWAHRAGALVIACAVLARPNGAPNRHAAHDLGQALAQLAIQATAEGIALHMMGGFDAAAARVALAVPEGIEPYTAVALGWPGDASQLDEALRGRETAPRLRLPRDEIAPHGGWGG